MKYRLENLNQVQYADDEIRRKELESRGFQVVGTAANDNPKAEAKTIKKAKPAKGEDKDAG